jgi:hypothetical protein
MTSRAREPALGSQWTIGAINGRRLERNRKSVDSPLERNGFERSVPRRAHTADSATVV